MMMFPLSASRLRSPVSRFSGSFGRENAAKGEPMERYGRPSTLRTRYVFVESYAQIFDSVDEEMVMKDMKRKPAQTPSKLASPTDNKTY